MSTVRLATLAEGSGSTDMALMRHRIRQYGEGVGSVEDMVALAVSISMQHRRMLALDGRVRVCSERLAVSKDPANSSPLSPRRVRAKSPSIGFSVPRP